MMTCCLLFPMSEATDRHMPMELDRLAEHSLRNLDMKA